MDYLKDKVDFAPGISDFVTQSPDVSDEFLGNIYQLIMKSAVEEAQKEDTEQSQNMMNHIKDIILQHAQLDEQEHQDADKLLDQI